MIKLMDLITEDGAEAGKLELVTTSLESARGFISNLFSKKGQALDDVLPDFDKNFNFAKNMASFGKTKRKDMPVIEKQDVKALQYRLKNGYIDVRKPHADPIHGSDPFPEGLTGEDAHQWLKNGLPKYDGAKPGDDVVKVTREKVKVTKLKPIQKQIYFDKSAAKVVKTGTDGHRKWLKTKTFIVSKDNFIIDGHHGYLSAILVDPTQTANVMKIDLPLNILLPMTLAYSDAIGNKRNG